MKRHFSRLLPLAALAVLAVATPALAAAPTFGPQATYPAGPGPIDIVRADFNSDGNPDLATANRFASGNDDVTVFLGNPDGTFQPKRDVAQTVSATSLASSDFNGDGNPDIAVTDPDSTPPSVAVVLGNGDGTFGAPAVYPSGGDLPFGVDSGDFGKDGSLDLAVTNATAGSDTVGILVNRGDGTFRQGPSIVVPNEQPRSVSSKSDFNEDGDLDLAVASAASNSVTVFFGRRGNTFELGPSRGVGDTPVKVISTDFNRDGNRDFATANSDSDSVSVVLGRGNGTFRSALGFVVGDTPFGLASADFDRDRRRDLATANNAATDPSENAGSVSILRGLGNGSFSTPFSRDVGDGPAAVAAGDFNSDGRQDFATANFGDDDPATIDSITVRLNTTGE